MTKFSTAPCIVVAMLASGAAWAQSPRVGEVASLRNEVTRSGAPVKLGDSVFRSQTITTGRDSSIRIAFLDRSNLAVGESSRVVLERFAFTESPNLQALVVNLPQGAFRFTSGDLDKRAYRIETPQGTMGVSGTVVDIAVTQSSSRFVLRDAARATICNRATPPQCADLTFPGDTITINEDGSLVRSTQAASLMDAQCAANPSLCATGVTGYATAPATGGVFSLGQGAAIAAGVGVAGGVALAISRSSEGGRPLSP